MYLLAHQDLVFSQKLSGCSKILLAMTKVKKMAISALLNPIFISVVVLIWAHAHSTLNSINSELPSFIHHPSINLLPMFYFLSS